MDNRTILFHNIPSVALTILEMIAVGTLCFIFGIFFERSRCCRRRGIDIN